MIVGSPTILNLVPGGVMKCVHVNQVNKNIEIQFKIMNGAAPYNVPEGVTCTIRGTKGDAFGYAAEAAVTAGSNVITVTLTEQLTAVAGAGNIFELVFVGAADDMKVSTENFILAVERQAMGEDTVISDSDLSYAEQVLDQLQSVGAVNAQVQQNKANLAAEISRAQAAEAAETAARQAADNTLQSDINAEASTRATTDASLQSQINQLVAPSGSAPSAAEVENARVGADGTVYQTLGDAIRTQVTDVKSAIEVNAEDIEDITISGVNLFDVRQVKSGGYYKSDGTIGSSAQSQYNGQYIPVDPSKTYALTPSSNIQVCRYDTSKGFIDRISVAKNSGVSFGESTYFIRLSRYDYEFDANYMVCEGTLPQTYAPYGRRINPDAIPESYLDGLESTVSGLEATVETNSEKIGYIVVDKGYVAEDQTYEGFTLKSGYTLKQNGDITTEYGSAYTTYQMVADRDFDLCFSASNYTPAGGVCMLGANGSRYRNIDNNLPTVDNPIHIAIGATVNICVYTSGNVFEFYWNNVGYTINPELIADIKDDINRSIICIATQADLINIYIPSKRKGSNYYFNIQLKHMVNQDGNYDVWKLDAGYLVQRNDDSFINPINILSGGEWTCALKIKGANDFMGGSYHGDEVINNAVILVDGTPHAFTAGETVECNTMTIMENTNLYNPDVSGELAAVVARSINITKDGIKTDQKVTWKHNYVMDWSYLGMFCIMRSVTDRGYSDAEYIPYNIGTKGFDNPMYVNNADCAKNRMLIGEYGESSKLHFELECTHISPELPTRPTYIYNGTPYNKIYMSFCPKDYSVAIGDVWWATHVYRMTENIT